MIDYVIYSLIAEYILWEVISKGINDLLENNDIENNTKGIYSWISL